MSNGDLTTAKHHMFWLTDDDEWVKNHLTEMESLGFQIVAMASSPEGVCVAMTRQ